MLFQVFEKGKPFTVYYKIYQVLTNRKVSGSRGVDEVQAGAKLYFQDAVEAIRTFLNSHAFKVWKTWKEEGCFFLPGFSNIWRVCLSSKLLICTDLMVLALYISYTVLTPEWSRVMIRSLEDFMSYKILYRKKIVLIFFFFRILEIQCATQKKYGRKTLPDWYEGWEKFSGLGFFSFLKAFWIRVWNSSNCSFSSSFLFQPQK